MRNVFAFVCLLITLQIKVFAASDTLWEKIGVAGINVSQVSFNNWSQGGENSILWTIFTNMNTKYTNNEWKLSNNLKMAYGRSKIGSSDYRTNDNELYLESIVSYNIKWSVDPYFSNTVRTGLSEGFDYKTGSGISVSNFFDPGYITQSLGFTYNTSKYFITRVGVGLQEVFTNKYRNYTDDPTTTTELEAFKLDTGIECVSDAKMDIDENLLYQSKLRLFTRFTSLDVWDVRWDNVITAKVTKYLNVNFNILVLYEKSQSPKTQMKEALQMGLTYSLF